ncbi:unnamed protein product [Candidula unifasciata]|uniref:L-Fucosyltransferase n=1 Tax=Candidula unifasciata TaxID=100452 RepID=A0A8S3ZG29_9EUPU|nr:unnamed protein product [Candidula unifasciata]
MITHSVCRREDQNQLPYTYRNTLCVQNAQDHERERGKSMCVHMATCHVILLNLTKANISIGGYLQSYKYFEDYADEVRQEFLFSDSIANEAYLIVHNLISERKGNLFVGVHIRRGDFLNGGNPKLGYGVPEKSYFSKAFKWMQSKFPDRNITYLVASDDLNWCNDNLKSDNVLALPNAPPAIHMAILSSCDHVIMSGGTYGWWSSFLAGGYVVYFKRFMSKDTTFGASFNPETYYPPLWTGKEK